MILNSGGIIGRRSNQIILMQRTLVGCTLDRVRGMYLQFVNAIILDDVNPYVDELLEDDDIVTKLTRMESGPS